MLKVKKRLPIKLATKYEIIQLINKKTPNSGTLAEFKDELRGEYTISNVKKNRLKIIKEYETSTST